MSSDTHRRVVRQMAAPCLLVYRAIIDHIVSDGAPPPDDVLAQRARTTPARVAMIREALAKQDWLTLDDDGALATIYPFSLTPTGITVMIDGSVRAERHAMCAIDALGVAPMLNRTVLVSAACAHCDTPITIAVTPHDLEGYTPPGTVVTARYAKGPAASSRCNVMRFACSHSHARQWLDELGAPEDVILPIEDAVSLAREQFHRCYSSGRVAKPFERRPPGASTV